MRSAWRGVDPSADSLVSQGWGRLASVDVVSAAFVDFILPPGYNVYVFDWSLIIPQTDGTDFVLRTSTDGGATFDAGAANYRYVYNFATSNGTSGVVQATNTSILLSSGAGNAANETSQGWCRLKNPSAAAYCWMDIVVANVDLTTVRVSYDGFAIRESAADVNAVRFLMLSGNITSGKISMYGMREAA